MPEPVNLLQRPLGRRTLLKAIGVGAGAVAVAPVLSSGALFADGAAQSPLVVLYLRGAADGLSMLVPHGDPVYGDLRPSISLDSGEVHDIDGYFGLHPAMVGLHGLYDSGNLALVHAAGSPDESRSHFDAQAMMEYGTPGDTSTADGWLGRHLEGTHDGDSALRAVAVADMLPATLRGYEPANAIGDLMSFDIHGFEVDPDMVLAAIEGFYAPETGPAAVAAASAITVIDELETAGLGGQGLVPPEYGQSALGNELWQVARLITADVGCEAAMVNHGGWDTHDAHGNATSGRIYRQVSELDSAVSAFLAEVAGTGAVLVVMTEFGRRAYENDSGGTDHGHGSLMPIGGDAISGGIYGDWPGLVELDRGDLQVRNDYRIVLTETLHYLAGAPPGPEIFPGFQAGDYLGFTR